MIAVFVVATLCLVAVGCSNDTANVATTTNQPVSEAAKAQAAQQAELGKRMQQIMQENAAARANAGKAPPPAK